MRHQCCARTERATTYGAFGISSNLASELLGLWVFPTVFIIQGCGYRCHGRFRRCPLYSSKGAPQAPYVKGDKEAVHLLVPQQ
eukprot:8167702-Pyramimonas_sp.AAC.1